MRHLKLLFTLCRSASVQKQHHIITSLHSKSKIKFAYLNKTESGIMSFGKLREPLAVVEVLG